MIHIISIASSQINTKVTKPKFQLKQIFFVVKSFLLLAKYIQKVGGIKQYRQPTKPVQASSILFNSGQLALIKITRVVAISLKYLLSYFYKKAIIKLIVNVYYDLVGETSRIRQELVYQEILSQSEALRRMVA